MSYYSPKPIEKFRFIHHFVPHPETNGRATLLSHKALLSYCLILTLIFGAIKVIPKYFPGVLGYAADITTTDLLKYTNDTREKRGLGELVINEKLSQAAAEKAKHMFKNNYWAHVSPDGVEPWDFINNADYDYSYAGENLAKNFSNSKEVVQAWYDSPSHRENLLNSNYEEIGFAVVNGVLDGYETTLVVQMFGKQRNPSYLAEVPVPTKPVQNIKIEPSIKPVQSAAVERPIIDIPNITYSVTLSFLLFICTLLILDYWYTRKHGIVRVTGNTFAHIMLLVVILLAVIISIAPGVVL